MTPNAFNSPANLFSAAWKLQSISEHIFCNRTSFTSHPLSFLTTLSISLYSSALYMSSSSDTLDSPMSPANRFDSNSLSSIDSMSWCVLRINSFTESPRTALTSKILVCFDISLNRFVSSSLFRSTSTKSILLRTMTCGFFCQLFAVQLQFSIDGLKISDRVTRSATYDVYDKTAPLNMPQKGQTQTYPSMRPFNQSWNVCQHHSPPRET
mmetsp:Transcript_15076/g.22445  ORF Transcript_15076/g.22445 Transcript_15076/m.22445 type:complete len:210 (+) Transcript_15076:118-747(+)